MAFVLPPAREINAALTGKKAAYSDESYATRLSEFTGLRIPVFI